MTRTFALVGDPVGHSLSPALQRAAFRAAAIEADYVLERVAPGRLAASWAGLLRRFAGLNVTIPHKEEAARLVDRLSPEARAAGSVNTVVEEAEGSVGHSTDGEGFLAALRRRTAGAPRRAVVLGTGGAARAVAASLARSGAGVLVMGRNRAAGETLARDLRAAGPGEVAYLGWGDAPLRRAVAGADLLVNATPLGGMADPSGCPLSPGIALDPGLVVFDLVYRPRRTPLLRRAAGAGCTVVEGIEMLIEQGARSFELWTGRSAPRQAMREAAVAALEAGEGRRAAAGGAGG